MTQKDDWERICAEYDRLFRPIQDTWPVPTHTEVLWRMIAEELERLGFSVNDMRFGDGEGDEFCEGPNGEGEPYVVELTLGAEINLGHDCQLLAFLRALRTPS